MTDVWFKFLPLWMSQYGENFQNFWSSINKVVKETKDTGHIKVTGICMTQEDLIKIWKQSLSAAPPVFLLKLQDARGYGDFQEQWWHLHPATGTSGSVTTSPLGIMWRKRRWMLRRRKKMRKELWRRTTRKLRGWGDNLGLCNSAKPIWYKANDIENQVDFPWTLIKTK